MKSFLVIVRSKEMSTVRIKVRPWRGKYVSRKEADQMRDLLLSMPKPDRTELKKEAQAFIKDFKATYHVQERK